MKNYINITILILLTTLVTSCKKFLDVLPSTQQVNPVSIKDFQEMLNGDSLSTGNYFLLDLMTDDARFLNSQYDIGNNIYRRFYLWEDELWDPNQQDHMYAGAYTRILQMNIILERVASAPKDSYNTDENRSNVISQALINRAWYYLQLVNIYGKHYNASTAQSDLGVPLVLTPNADAFAKRATVQEIYTQILADLKQAVDNPYLKAKGTDIIHPGKSAGYALLARTYLYMADYVNAEIYADLALEQQDVLLDLNQVKYFPEQLLSLVPNPEIMLGRISTDQGFYSAFSARLTMDKDLQTMFGGNFPNDLRFKMSFSNYYAVYNLNSVNSRVMVFDNSVSVPEVVLIKAECAARRGDHQLAGTHLDRLRQHRFPPTALTQRTYTISNIMSFVLEERRKELMFRGGLRLFDLKRLNLDINHAKDIVRKNDAGSEILATLPSQSNRYVVPFSLNVRASNPNIVQNPR